MTRSNSVPTARPSTPPPVEGIGTGAGRTVAAVTVAPRNLSIAEVRKLMKQPRVRGVAAKEDRTYNGQVFHSKAECLYAFGLDMQKSAGAIHAWQSQVVMPIRLNGIHICNVMVDFGIKDTAISDWRYVEVKGFSTELFLLKKKLLLAMYPGLIYEVVRA